MKKLKSSVALFVSLIMVLSLMPQMAMAATVQAPSYTDAYKSYFCYWQENNGYNSNPDTVDRFSCVTNEIAHSGNHSIALRRTGEASDNGFIGISQIIPKSDGSTYTVSFWATGTEPNGLQCITFAGDGGWQNPNIQNFTKGDTNGIWTKYSSDITINKDNYVFTILTDGNTDGWYIDDISIVKAGTTTNLITNGGFEEKTAEYTSAYEGYFTGWNNWSSAQADNNLKFMCVTDEKVHSGAHSIVIRHVGEEGNICLAQSGLTLEAGTYTISFWAVGTKTDSDTQGVTLADTWRKYSMKNRQPVQTDGIWSKYEIEVTMSGTETAMTFVTDGDTESWYIDDISLTKEGTTDNRIKNGGFEINPNATYTSEFSDYLNLWGNWTVGANIDYQTAFYCATDKFAHDGKHSLAIRYTAPTETASTYISVAQDVSYGSGTYTISFWATGDYSEDFCRVTLNGNDWKCHNLSAFRKEQSDGIWTKYTKDITVENDNNAITFLCVGKTKGWYIDDISFVKQGTSENLIANGGFEFSGIPTYTNANDAYLAGWVEKHDGAAPDNNLRFTCVTNEISHSGDYAVAIRHADSTKVGGNLIGVRQILSPLEGATYTLSFWAVETRTNTAMLGVTFDGTKWEKTDISGFTKVETDGIWAKYSRDIAVTDGNYKFTIFTDGETEGWYIDDISLIKQGTSKNLLANGGFELNTLREEYTASYASYFAGWDPALKTKAALDNVNTYLCVAGDVAHSGNHSVHIRHTDANQNYKAITLYQAITADAGTYTISFWSTGEYSETDDVVILYDSSDDNTWISNELSKFTKTATDGEWTKYELTLNITAADQIRIISNGNTEGWYIDDISLTKAGSTKNILKNAGFELTAPEPDEPTPAQDLAMTALEGTQTVAADGTLSMAFITNDSIDPTGYKNVKFGFTDNKGVTTYKGYALDKLISSEVSLGEEGKAFVGVGLIGIPAEFAGVSMWLSNDTLAE